MATVREYKIKDKQLPTTEECVKKINRIYEEFSTSLESIKKAEEEMSNDYLIFSQPMLYLANILYNENDGWAVELAQFIAVLNGDQYINLHDLQILKPTLKYL